MGPLNRTIEQNCTDKLQNYKTILKNLWQCQWVWGCDCCRGPPSSRLRSPACFAPPHALATSGAGTRRERWRGAVWPMTPGSPATKRPPSGHPWGWWPSFLWCVKEIRKNREGGREIERKGGGKRERGRKSEKVREHKRGREWKKNRICNSVTFFSINWTCPLV